VAHEALGPGGVRGVQDLAAGSVGLLGEAVVDGRGVIRPIPEWRWWGAPLLGSGLPSSLDPAPDDAENLDAGPPPARRSASPGTIAPWGTVPARTAAPQ
jgi:hypothetical protein